MSKAGDKLIAAALEAQAIARGETKAAGMFVPADVDVKAIRKKIGATQEEFAAEFCFSLTQVRDWEQGRSRPLGSSRAYLLIIQEAPDMVRNLLLSMKAAKAA